jgi:hypothetical protein
MDTNGHQSGHHFGQDGHQWTPRVDTSYISYAEAVLWFSLNLT